MHLHTGDFSRVLGETFGAVRNVYGRRGREPRDPAGEEYTPGKYRRYYWPDAVAWRITRQLCELGLTWDQAAPLVSESYAAHWALRQPDDAAGKFFAVWASVTIPTARTEGPEHTFTHWLDTPGEIAEVVALDASADATGACFTGIAGVRMVSLHRAIVTARFLAREAGFVPDGDGFRPLGGIMEAAE